MFIVCQIAKTLFEGYANSSHSDALLFVDHIQIASWYDTCTVLFYFIYSK